MHAFLLIGNNSEALGAKTQELGEKLKAKILEFPLKKIEDVRSLNNLIRLSITEPTLIVSENIHEATTEALNAFLKNLEEPQEDLYFALTALSTRKVLPTIVSRCQVMKVKSKSERVKSENAEKFLKFSVGERLAFVDKIKDRGEAIKFVEDLIFYEKEKRNYKNMENYLSAYKNLNANGNVSLQLTNLTISLV